MSCRITEWTIKPDHANHVSKTLLKSTSELAGAIIFENNNLESSRVVLNSEGKTDSVHINLKHNHMVSFHTHPASAYINAECIYGHPSGDDLREFIRLSLLGALNHAVFSLEGMYLVQIHPRFVRYMSKLPKSSQKYILDNVYTYFSDYHGKRAYENVIKNNYTPREFVQACNLFKLHDLNLPEYIFDPMKYPDHLISCVWFFCDNLLKNEKNYNLLWENINTKNIDVTFTNRTTPMNFSFLLLNNNERNLNTVLHTLNECMVSSESH